MAKSLNRVTIIGNLGRDPEISALPSGNTVCKFSVATTESYKDKNGNWQDITDWHNVVLWERLAEFAQKNLHKGSKVYIEGKLKSRSYEKDGVTRYVTEIKGENIVLMSERSQNASEPGHDYHTDHSKHDMEDDDVPF